MPDRDNNVEIEFVPGGNTGSVATDYPTSGVTNAHVQIVKVCWGEPSEANRVTTAAPLPVNVISGNTLEVSGIVSGTGNFTVVNSNTSPFRIQGTTSGVAVPVTGYVQGVTGGVAVGVTGTVTVGNTFYYVQGISGGIPFAITGGRGLCAATDSITVSGTVGVTGGRYLLPAFDGVKVYNSTLGTTIPVQIWGSNGAVGMSGSALNVNLVGAGITATVTVGAVIGISQADPTVPLYVSGATAGPAVRVKGALTGGAVEVGWSSALPVSISGSIGGISFSDVNMVNRLDTINNNLTTVKGYVDDMRTKTDTIINRLPGGGVYLTETTLSIPANAISGELVLPSNQTELQITTRELSNGITIKALLSNTGDVKIRTAGAGNGYYYLSRGESLFLSIGNTNQLFFSSNGVQCNLCYIGS
jgi:hypothetical protein